MDFQIPTFAFEIINFLALVWLLQRFFYKPVLGVIDRRKAMVDKIMSDAQDIQRQAEELESQYKQKLQIWQDEKTEARKALKEEMDNERARALADLEERLSREEAKLKTRVESKMRELTRDAEVSALEMAGGFMSHLLSRVTGPQLEEALVAMAIEDLGKLDEEKKRELTKTLAEGTAEVATAYPLPAKSRQALEAALGALGKATPKTRYQEDPALVAGMRINLAHWVLKANLADELKFFQEEAHGQSRRITNG
ncbi:MAG: F0F1 ATP synthase subunit delta [Deltaproteobacteria bacterium]|nr:F0F1 ATP synthase subunit delta [Deltaproteobacteria bacterium]